MKSLSTAAERVVAWLDAETAKRGMEALEDADTCAALCEHFGWQDDEGQQYVEEAYEYYEDIAKNAPKTTLSSGANTGAHLSIYIGVKKMALPKTCYTKTGALRADVRQALFDLACTEFASRAGRLRIHGWARNRAGYYDRRGRLVALPTYRALSILAAHGVKGAAAVLSMPVKNDAPRGGAAGDYIDVPARFKGRKELINAYESIGFMVDPGH